MSSTSSTTALIGGTGFVGGNLASQHTFEEILNSSTIAGAAGKHYELLVSAAPSAVKWKANKFPEEDLAQIEMYIAHLRQIEADFFIGISTCDVYEVPVGVDEDTDIKETLSRLHPYGKHRFLLEEFMREHFKSHLIVRLPALFGPGLKKNVIFDFLNDNALDLIHHAGSFQFYNLRHLWRDITIARECGVTLLNITTEPVSVAEVARECFGREFTNTPESKPATYDVRSKHAHLFGGKDGYMYPKDAVLTGIREFVASQKAS